MNAEAPLGDIDDALGNVRVPGQSAVAWRCEFSFSVLQWSGSVLSNEDDPGELFEWADQLPPSQGLWVWEGWAYVTSGTNEDPHDCEMVIGGDWRRLTPDELCRLDAGERAVFRESEGL